MPKGFLRTVLALLAATVGGAAFADDARLVKRSYPVGEFVVSVQPPGLVPPPPVAVAPAAHFAAPTVPPTQMWHMQSEVRRNAEALARVVVKMVKPHSWTGTGGAGSITFDEASSALVVIQTADVHAHVADLIASLRRVHAASMPMVMLEVTSVEVPETFFESAGVDAEVQAVGGTSVPTPACPDGEACQVMMAVRGAEGKKPAVVTLSADQVQCLMKCCQANRHVNVLARPKLIVEDMQTGFIQIGETAPVLTEPGPNGVERKPQVQTVQVGTTIRATPKVSADRRFVELQLNYQVVEPNAEMEVRSHVVIPTGRTLMLAGPVVMRKQVVVSKPAPLWAQAAVRRETRPMKCHHLLLVTAKVMSQPSDCCAAAPACKASECGKAADCKACPEVYQTVGVAKPARPAAPEVSRLVAAYRQACVEGRSEDALRLAMQALSRDPNCFADQK
jgi:hypothetical protein